MKRLKIAKQSLLTGAMCLAQGLIMNASYAQNFQWVKAFGGTSYDGGSSISIDASGNIYTTGWFSETADFDPGAGTANLTAGEGGAIFVQKMAASGNFLWAKAFGSGRSSSIRIDAAGNVYTTGAFWGTADFDPGAGTVDLTAAGNGENPDIFVHKMDASGNFLWAKAFGGPSFDKGLSISVDASGNVYTTGFFQETVDFDPGVETADLTAAGDADIFVQKMDASGNFLWAKALGGTSYDEGSSIRIDASGNVYTTGAFWGTADFDPGAGTANLTAAGSADIFVQKMDASGNFLWAKAFGGTFEDIPGFTMSDGGSSISIDASGNVYTTGTFRETADFDPGAGTTNLTSLGYTDIFVQKMDASGNFLWAKAFGGNFGGDGGSSISTDSSGNVYTTGSFGGTVDFDPGSGTANLTAVGSADVFVQKMDSSGNFLWAKVFGGPSFDNGSSSIDASGNVYTTGAFFGTIDFDPGAGTTNLTSAGDADIYVQKLSPGASGILEIGDGIQVLAYPNPSKGCVQISFEKPLSDVTIKVTNVQGKVVFWKQIDAVSNEQLHIQGTAGLYFLSVNTPNGQHIVKLVKE